MNQTVVKPTSSAPTKLSDNAAAVKSATAKPTPAKPTPAKPVPPKPAAKKKSGIGCLPKLIMLLLVAAVAAAVWYFPAQVEALTGVQIPTFIKEIASRAANSESVMATTSREPDSSVTAIQTEATEINEAIEVTKEAAEGEQSHAKILQLQQAADVMQQQAQLTQSRLVRSEQQLSRLVAQIADLQQQQSTQQLQLQIIDLRLQLEGDTVAAAEALSHLAASTEDIVTARTLLDEAARIDNLVPRSVLLSLLEELQRPTATTVLAENDNQETHATDFVGKVIALFNIRHTPTTVAVSPVQQQLARLEVLLLTGREDLYWQHLLQVRKDATGDIRVENVLQRLFEYGAPNYQLQLPSLL